MERSRSLTRCLKRPIGRSGNSSYLPEELIFKILSQSYVTSLLRCTSVCKLWLSIILKPEFLKAQHINGNSSLLIITSRIDAESYGLCDVTIVYPEDFDVDVDDDDNDCSVKLPQRPPFNDLLFVASFNGIACVSTIDCSDIYLFNPLTSMSYKLPPSTATLTLPYRQFRLDVAFGFDCVSNDYKVLKIAYQTAHITTSTLVNVVALDLYSFNSGSWTEIELDTSRIPSLICKPVVPILKPGPVVDGVLYLEAVNTIVTFHLHNQTFGLIPYPSFKHTRKSVVLDFQGSVAVVLESVRDGSLDEKEVALWAMEAVSDEVFWNKIFTFDSALEEIDWVYLYYGANKFVAKTRLGQVLYDYKKKMTKYIRLPAQSFFVKALNHIETFLSVEKVKGVKDS